MATVQRDETPCYVTAHLTMPLNQFRTSMLQKFK